jgi:hypothetical protein
VRRGMAGPPCCDLPKPAREVPSLRKRWIDETVGNVVHYAPVLADEDGTSSEPVFDCRIRSESLVKSRCTTALACKDEELRTKLNQSKPRTRSEDSKAVPGMLFKCIEMSTSMQPRIDDQSRQT